MGSSVGAVDHERTLAPSPFPGDDGSASPSTRDRLARAAAEPGATAYLGAVVALCADRLLVPVVATATRMGETTGGLSQRGGATPLGPPAARRGHPGTRLFSDKEAEMAVVMLQTPDGRQALLAFSGLDALQAWQPGARPVPVTLDRAAETALAEGATAVLVDCAGPATLLIEGEVLASLAAGHRLVETADGGFGWAMAAPE